MADPSPWSWKSAERSLPIFDWHFRYVIDDFRLIAGKIVLLRAVTVATRLEYSADALSVWRVVCVCVCGLLKWLTAVWLDIVESTVISSPYAKGLAETCHTSLTTQHAVRVPSEMKTSCTAYGHRRRSKLTYTHTHTHTHILSLSLSLSLLVDRQPVDCGLLLVHFSFRECLRCNFLQPRDCTIIRSEEHTSELQSR